MSLTVYIAGSYNGRHRIAKEAAKLKLYGFDVLSKWFEDDYFVEKAWDGNFSGDVAHTMAHMDFNQILQARVFILDTIDKSSTGGSDSELGIALAREFDHKTRIIHIGPYRNIFQTLAREHFETWEEFFNMLDRKEEEAIWQGK